MIRRLSFGVAIALLALGCTKSEPIPVPSDFSDPVRALLTTVDPGATPTFKAETCANLPVDGPTEGARRIQSEATLNVDPVAAVKKLRESGVERGWQPYEVEGSELALTHTLPDGVPYTLTTKAEGSSLHVRVAVEYRCSSSSGFDFGRTGAPQVLPAQAEALESHRDEAVSTTERFAKAFGASASIPEKTPAVSCHTDTASGIEQVLSVTGRPISPKSGTARDAIDKITDALGNRWAITTQVQARRTVLNATGPDGLTASIIVVGDSPVTHVAIEHFVVPCIPAK